MPRLGEDLLPWLMACAKGELEERPLKTYGGSAVAIVLASRGYPESSESGNPISGLADASIMRDTAVFQAGTAIANGKVVTAGGRVLAVVARGADADGARAAAYAAANKVSFDGMQRRDDIGSDSQG